MSNAILFHAIILASMSMIFCALVIQYKNKETVHAIVEGGMDKKSTLYFGNLAYRTFINKRITLLKFSLYALLFLFCMGILNHGTFDSSNTQYSMDMVWIFSFIWGVFFMVLIAEYFLIKTYSESVSTDTEIEQVKNRFRTARFCYNHLNRLIKVVALSCVSLLLVMI